MKYIVQAAIIFSFICLLFAAYSLARFELIIWDIPIKKTGFREFVYDIPEHPFGKAIQKTSGATVQEIKQAPMDSSSQRILLIGDSMLEGLGVRLRDYSEHNKHDLKTVIWYSSSTEYFGRSDTLKYFIKQYKPTYIMLVLGANELFVSDIIRKRKPYVRHILKQIDSINFVWVGPPNWKEDTGINDLIVNSVGKGNYFPSKNLTYQRTRDGAHPTRASSAVWMDSIAVWVMRDSNRPILLEKPLRKSSRSGNVTLLQPLN
jgi:hypothetical protein